MTNCNSQFHITRSASAHFPRVPWILVRTKPGYRRDLISDIIAISIVDDIYANCMSGIGPELGVSFLPISLVISSVRSLLLLLSSHLFTAFSTFLSSQLVVHSTMAITKALKSRNASLLSSRRISSQTLPRRSSITSDHTSSEKFPTAQPIAVRSPPKMPKPTPLSILPLSSILRSLATMSISSSPVRQTLPLNHQI